MNTETVTSGADLTVLKQPLGQHSLPSCTTARKVISVNFSVFDFKHQVQLSLVSTAILPCHLVAKIQVHMTTCTGLFLIFRKGKHVSWTPPSFPPILVPATEIFLQHSPIFFKAVFLAKIKGKDSRGTSSHNEGDGESYNSLGASFLQRLLWAHTSHLWPAPLFPPLGNRAEESVGC